MYMEKGQMRLNYGVLILRGYGCEITIFQVDVSYDYGLKVLVGLP